MGEFPPPKHREKSEVKPPSSSVTFLPEALVAIGFVFCVAGSSCVVPEYPLAGCTHYTYQLASAVLDPSRTWVRWQGYWTCLDVL